MQRGGEVVEQAQRRCGSCSLHRHAGALEERAAVPGGHRLELLRRLHAGGDGDHAPTARTHGADQRVELRHRRDGRRHRHAAVARMVERVGSAEPNRAVGHGVGDQRLHAREFFGRRFGARCEASSPITAVRMVEWPASTARFA